MPIVNAVPSPPVVVNVLAANGTTTSVTVYDSGNTLVGPGVPPPPLAQVRTSSVLPSAQPVSLWSDPGIVVPWIGSLVVLVGIVLLGRRTLQLRREVKAEIAALRARRAATPQAMPR